MNELVSPNVSATGAISLGSTSIARSPRLWGPIPIPAGRSGGRTPPSRDGLSYRSRLEATSVLKKRSRRLRRRYG